MCSKGPILIVNPGYIMYGNLRPEDAVEIVQKHLVEGKPVSRLVISEDHLFNRFYRIFGDSEFFGRQMRIALRNCGIIDPEKLDDYLAMRGYEALARVLTEMTPQQVIEEVKKSGLRGRGGAGFPTGLKWEYTARQPESEKYVICNADEGDPGAFMDRSAIEGDPHTILEGMIIGGYAIGSHQGIIYIRAEYPLAVQRLQKAIEDARREGLLGERILGSDFSFDIRICLGAGAFVCGEETAMIHSIEGYRGMPRPRPPYPSVSGLFGKPTLINNVANVPLIINNGADWYASIGTEKSKGTKIFSLVGKINNTGLVEVPMGMTLREIIYDIGGGIPNGRKFKAVQTGGPSGGCIPESLLDLPVDFDKLYEVGSMMGSGGMIVMDDRSCMVDVAKYFLSFLQEESCGKCVPCREGIRRMREILEDICAGKGQEGDIELLEKIATGVADGSLCALGSSAPNPVLSTLRYFRDEYDAHIKEHRCPAGVCKALITYSIDAEKCTGCTLCSKVCPVQAISGEKKKAHTIDNYKCTRCGACFESCKFDAINVK